MVVVSPSIALDFDAQTVTVDRQVATGSSRPHLGPPKTDASYRIVPVLVLDALADHQVEFPPGPPGLPVVNRQGVEIGRTRTGLIFTNRADRWSRTARLPPHVPHNQRSPDGVETRETRSEVGEWKADLMCHEILKSSPAAGNCARCLMGRFILVDDVE